MAHDRLEHDDGIVDDQADGDGQAQQRDVIDAVAQRVHQPEGHAQADRHRDRGDQRRGDAAEEQEADQHHQPDGDDQAFLHVVHGGSDGQAAVEHDVELGARRQRLLQRRQRGTHAIHDVDGIRIGLAEHGEDERPLPVPPGGDALVLHAVGDVRHLVQPDRCVGAPGDDEAAEGLGILRLVVGTERELLPGAVEQPDRCVGVGLRDRLLHRVEG